MGNTVSREGFFFINTDRFMIRKVNQFLTTKFHRLGGAEKMSDKSYLSFNIFQDSLCEFSGPMSIWRSKNAQDFWSVPQAHGGLRPHPGPGPFGGPICEHLNISPANCFIISSWLLSWAGGAEQCFIALRTFKIIL